MKAILIILLLFICACDETKDLRDEGESPAPQIAQNFSFKVLQFNLKYEWLSGPFGNPAKSSHLKVTLLDESGKPISLPEGYQMKFYAHMPSMGHGAKNQGVFVEVKEGVFENYSIIYSMGFEWENNLWIFDENQKKVDEFIWQEFI